MAVPYKDDNDGLDSPPTSVESSIAPFETKVPWYGYLWDAFGKPPAERRLLLKLDLTLLVFSVLGLLIRYIDQTNLSTACELFHTLTVCLLFTKKFLRLQLCRE